MSRDQGSGEKEIAPSRNLRLEWRSPAELEANPKNWRRHPAIQQDAMKAAIGRVGWAGAALYNEATGRLIDGHLRRDLDVEEIPVLIGSWTEEEEAFILATLDPMAGLAERDADALTVLLQDFKAGDEAITFLLDSILKGSGPVEAPARTERLEQAIQLRPAREYVVIMCGEDPSEFERLKDLLGLGLVRRGGYREGSPFDAVGTQRVVPAAEIIRLLESLREVDNGGVIVEASR